MTNVTNQKAIVLFSSGLDSVVNVSILQHIYKIEPILLFIDYGQKALEAELQSTKRFASANGLKLITHKISDRILGSKLTDGNSDIDVDVSDGREAPVDLVPYRNLQFALIGAQYARKLNINIVSFAFNISEMGAYPDNTDRFLENLNEMFLATTYYPYEQPIFFISPTIRFTKTELVKIGSYLRADFKNSTSCYYPINNLACGVCNSCRFRIEAFKRAKVKDHIDYAIEVDFDSQPVSYEDVKMLLDIALQDKQKLEQKLEKFGLTSGVSHV